MTQTKEERRAYKRDWYAAHIEERRAYANAYGASYRVTHSKEMAEHCRSWRALHKEEVLAYNRAYHVAYREEIAAYHKLYRVTHREEKAEDCRRRRAFKRGATVGPINLEAIKVRDRMRCAICGKRVEAKDLSFDHSWPLSLHGPHSQDNQRVAHRRCNSKRGAGRLPVQMVLM